jgi:serine phosphatase RsbU (regulator of sigma subunit)
MGHLRGLLRACAWDNAAEPTPTDPARVLDRVDRLVQGLDVVPLATLVYARAVCQGDGWRLTWANAGHPAPLLRLPDGTVDVLEGGSTLLGVVDGPARETACRQVPAGSTLLGYTDGVVERRGEHLDVGVRRLAGILAAADPAQLDDLILRVVREVGDARDDDVAVIAVRLD